MVLVRLIVGLAVSTAVASTCSHIEEPTHQPTAERAIWCKGTHPHPPVFHFVVCIKLAFFALNSHN